VKQGRIDEDATGDSLAAVLQFGTQWAEEAQREFAESDADWRPVLLLVTPDGSRLILDLPECFFASGELKDVLALGVILALRGVRAVAGALVTSCWVSRADRDDAERVRAFEAGEVVPARDPLAKEMVSIIAVSERGTAIKWAVITRSLDDPPRLGEWTTEPCDGGDVAGRFVTALELGVRRSGRG